jgi:hypothetical protein
MTDQAHTHPKPPDWLLILYNLEHCLQLCDKSDTHCQPLHILSHRKHQAQQLILDQQQAIQIPVTPLQAFS